MASTPRRKARPPDPEQRPGFLLWVVTNRWQAAQRATLEPLGLTHVQLVLLAALAELDAPVSQRRLADHAATDPMMTSQVLRTLEGKGLVRREAEERDRRAWAVAITPAGRRLANRAARAVERCDAEFFSPLGTRVAPFTGHLRTLKEGTDG